MSRVPRASLTSMKSDPTPPSVRHPQRARAGEKAQLLSCRECQKRKTKCDKQVPCSNCTLRGIDCQPVAVDPARPRKKRFAEAELLARLRRYEALLSSAGIDYSQSISRSSPTSDTTASDRKRPRRAGSHTSLPSQAPVPGTAETVDDGACSPPSGSIIDPNIGHLESIFGI